MRRGSATYEICVLERSKEDVCHFLDRLAAAPPERDIEEKIVNLLRDQFDLKFTLVGFTEIAGRDLLELLNMALFKVSDTQPEKLGTEKTEGIVSRMSEFLPVLKYEFPC
jgi:hypothetical protein